MQTQVELELEAYQFGKARILSQMRGNEEKGRAHNNPYAQAIYRRFVLPLAEIIKSDVATKRVCRRSRKTLWQRRAPHNREYAVTKRLPIRAGRKIKT